MPMTNDQVLRKLLDHDELECISNADIDRHDGVPPSWDNYDDVRAIIDRLVIENAEQREQLAGANAAKQGFSDIILQHMNGCPACTDATRQAMQKPATSDGEVERLRVEWVKIDHDEDSTLPARDGSDVWWGKAGCSAVALGRLGCEIDGMAYDIFHHGGVSKVSDWTHWREHKLPAPPAAKEADHE